MKIPTASRCAASPTRRARDRRAACCAHRRRGRRRRRCSAPRRRSASRCPRPSISPRRRRLRALLRRAGPPLDARAAAGGLEHAGIAARGGGAGGLVPHPAHRGRSAGRRGRLDERGADGAARVLVDPDPGDALPSACSRAAHRSSPISSPPTRTSPPSSAASTVAGLPRRRRPVRSRRAERDRGAASCRSISISPSPRPRPASGGDRSARLRRRQQLRPVDRERLARVARGDRHRRGVARAAWQPPRSAAPSPLQMRDIFRQTIADQLALVRAVAGGHRRQRRRRRGLSPSPSAISASRSAAFSAASSSRSSRRCRRRCSTWPAGASRSSATTRARGRSIQSVLADAGRLESRAPSSRSSSSACSSSANRRSIPPIRSTSPAAGAPSVPGFAPRRVLIQEGIGDELVEQREHRSARRRRRLRHRRRRPTATASSASGASTRRAATASSGAPTCARRRRSSSPAAARRSSRRP